jgi:hypothetical protein
MIQHINRRMMLLSGAAAIMLVSGKAFSAWPEVTVHKDPTCGAVAVGLHTWKPTASK